MAIGALVAWMLAAAVGCHLLKDWLTQQGLRQQATKVTRYPSTLVFGHSAVAVVGLAGWAVFLTVMTTPYAWGAFAALVVAVLTGLLLLTRWLMSQDGGRHARGQEQRFPLAGVLAHGAVAIVTFVLVLLTVIAA